MDGTLSVYARLQTLLRETDMSATDFIAICAACGVKISAAAISRASTTQHFTGELDKLLGPTVLRLEQLQQRAWPFHLSYRDADHVKPLLDLLDEGHTVEAKLELRASD